MYRVLVTGGCGFIGSNLVRYLLETDPEVRVVNFDALTYAGNLANLADLDGHPRYQFIKGDITDRQAVREALRGGVRAILNLAAESHVDRSIHDSGPFVRTNVLGTQVLLDCARELQVPRFLQVSTDEVYGSLPQQPLSRQQSGRRLPRSQLRPHLWAAGRDHALLEQLRPLSVPGEAHSPVCDQPAP